MKLRRQSNNYKNEQNYNMMRKIQFIAVLAIILGIFAGCKDKPAKTAATISPISDTAGVSDTTIYGICGEGTMMNTLELKCDDGSLRHFMVNEDDTLGLTVQGGMLAGDRMAVIAHVSYGDTIADKIINLTSLQGRWTSLDKDFEIRDGGMVKSFTEAEANPWTSWKIFNGQLVFGRDTFDINELGADSLMLENKEGIFVYKRGKVK